MSGTSDPAPQDKCHVLVVDDDLDIRESLAAALEGDKFTITLAAHGREVLDYLKSHHPPSVILLDLRMPVMNARELCRELRQDAIWRTIPIILISADPDLQQAASELDVYAWIAKPIDLDQLTAVLSEACCQSQRLRPFPKEKDHPK